MKHKPYAPQQISLLLLLAGCLCATARAENINDAVHRGDIAAVRRMLRLNPRLVAFRGPDTSNPLHWAAWDGRADIALLLINAGADVNDRRALDGETPLWLAAWPGRDDVVKLLVQHGADPEIRANDGSTPFHIVAANGHMDSVERFLIIGQNIETLNAQGNTPLCVAAQAGQLEVAKCLIGNGANIHHRNNQGQSAYELAVAGHHDNVAGLLSDYQVALDARAARDFARKSSGVVIRKGYQNWGGANVSQKQVYAAGFAGSTVGPEWSTRPLPGKQQAPLGVSVTPRGGHRFLGELSSQAVRLALSALPAHTQVSVAFDLYIIRSWDGNDFRFGPDIFTLSVPDGPTLLQTTFNNPIYLERARTARQAYPGEYAGDFNPPHSGAVEVNSLGYSMEIFGNQTTMDSTYEISYTFTHRGSDLALDFAAQGLEALDNESWGIANVQVSVASEANAPVLVHHTAAPVPTRVVRTPSHATTHHTRPPKPAAHHSASGGNKPPVSHAAHHVPLLHPREKPPGL